MLTTSSCSTICSKLELPGLKENSTPSASRSEGLRIARNSLVLGGGQAVVLLLGFATTILTTDLLGDAYGLFLGAQRFVALFLVVAQFGLHPLLVREIASKVSRPGPLIGTALVMRSALAAAFLLAIAVGSEAAGYLPEHRWLIWAFAAIELTGIDGIYVFRAQRIGSLYSPGKGDPTR